MRIFKTAVRCCLASAAMVGAAQGQTKLDLRTQGKSVDFAAAPSTRPSKTGTALPGTCAVGETFLKTDAAAGKNLYICTGTNVWTVQGVEMPDPTGKATQVLTNDGTSFSWTAIGGDVSGGPAAVTVTGLNGRRLGSLAPLDGQFLKWNGVTNQWEGVTLAAALSVFGRSSTVTAQTGDYSFPQISGTVAVGQLPATAGDITGTVTSTTVVKIQSRPVAAIAPTTGQVLAWTGTQWAPMNVSGGVASTFGRIGAVTAQTDDYSFSQIAGTVAAAQLPAAGGDLSGSLPNATVAALQGRGVAATAPSTGHVLTWNGAQWSPSAPTGQVTSAFGRIGAISAQTGDYSFAQISGTAAGGQLPAVGGDLSGALTGATVVKLQGRTLTAVQPTTGQILTWDGVQWGPSAPSGVTSTFGRVGAVSAQTGDYSFAQISGSATAGQLPAAGGDLSGALQAPTVAKIQNRTVAASSPSTGQALVWDGTQWTPQNVSGGVPSVYGRTGAVAAQTGDYSFAQISGTAAVGQLPSTGGDLNGSLTGARVTGLQNRPVGATVPATGQALVWDGTQWAPQNVSGGVPSVYGRTGAVTAQTGDYSFAQISGTVAAGQLPASGGDLSGALQAPTVAKLQGRTVAATAPTTGQVLAWSGAQWAPSSSASGGVSTVYGRTGTVAAQTGDYSFSQISGTATSGQLPAAGGDLSGTLSAATVSKLQNRTMAATAPATGQVLGWDGAQWTPQNVIQGSSANAVDKTVANTYTAGARQTFVPDTVNSGLNVTPNVLPLVPAAGDVAVDSLDSNKLKIYDGTQWNTLATATNYVAAFTTQTSVLVLGSTHRLGTANLSVDCYDSSNPAQRVEPDKVLIDSATFNVTVNFTTAQTGKCVISGQTSTAAGSGGAGMASQLGDLSLVLTTTTVLTAGLNCAPATPCNVRLGSAVFSVITSSTVTLTAGTGAAYLYLDPSGVLTVGHNLTLSCSTGCTAASGVTSFPAGSIPLFSWTATNGTWDTSGGTDRRAFLSTRNVTAGAGIVALDTGTQTVVAVDSATVPSYVAGVSVLDFTSIAPGACSESTMPLPGAAAGDALAPGWPAGMESGLIGTMRVSAVNTVAVRVCNLSGSTVDPAAGTFRAVVVRSF